MKEKWISFILGLLLWILVCYWYVMISKPNIPNWWFGWDNMRWPWSIDEDFRVWSWSFNKSWNWNENKFKKSQESIQE